jgi:hypothetical protein
MPEFDDVYVLLRPKDGRFVAAIPPLHIYVQADSPQQAFDLLEQKRAQLKQDVRDFGEFEDLRIQAQFTSAKNGGLGQFAVKCAIALGMATIAISMAAALFIAALSPALQRLKPPNSRQLFASLEQQLHRAAQSSDGLTSERREKILSDLRVVVAKWRPFLDEIGEVLTQPGK